MDRVNRRHALQGIAAAAAALGAGVRHASAQAGAWPNERVIRWLIGLPPAGSADPLTRAIAEPLSKRLRQSFVIENKAGGNQSIAAREVANAAADGYTLLTIAGPLLYANPPPMIGAGLDPVIQIAQQPMIIAGTTQRPTTDLAAVIAAAKAAPADWSFGTAGVASSQHIAGEWLNLLAGTRILHVPYRGGSAALTDAVSGQIPLLIIGAGPVIEHIRAGTLRGYALTTKARLKTLPDIPTLAELGFPQFDLSQWVGVAVRAGTPSAIVQQLNREIDAVIKLPAVQEMFDQFGAVPVGGSAEQWGRVYADDLKTWTGLVRQLNIPLL